MANSGGGTQQQLDPRELGLPLNASTMAEPVHRRRRRISGALSGGVPMHAHLHANLTLDLSPCMPSKPPLPHILLTLHAWPRIRLHASMNLLELPEAALQAVVVRLEGGDAAAARLTCRALDLAVCQSRRRLVLKRKRLAAGIRLHNVFPAPHVLVVPESVKHGAALDALALMAWNGALGERSKAACCGGATCSSSCQLLYLAATLLPLVATSNSCCSLSASPRIIPMHFSLAVPAYVASMPPPPKTHGG